MTPGRPGASRRRWGCRGACGGRGSRGWCTRVHSSAFYLTHVVWVVLSCLCCPACRGDMRRPPLDDLRVPSTELEDARRWPWLSLCPGTRDGDGRGWRAWRRLAGFRARAVLLARARAADALFEAVRRGGCAGRSGCRCWRSCRWSRSAAAGHGARLRRGELRGGPDRAAAPGAGRRCRCPAWDDGRIRLAVRREQLAAAGRGDQPGAAVLPLLRAREGERADDPGLAVLAASRRWSRAARRGRCRWTRSGSARPTTPTEVTAAQVREVVTRLIAAGHWQRRRPGHPGRSSTPATT